jgi:hypothetical protein
MEEGGWMGWFSFGLFVRIWSQIINHPFPFLSLVQPMLAGLLAPLFFTSSSRSTNLDLPTNTEGL